MIRETVRPDWGVPTGGEATRDGMRAARLPALMAQVGR